MPRPFETLNGWVGSLLYKDLHPTNLPAKQFRPSLYTKDNQSIYQSIMKLVFSVLHSLLLLKAVAASSSPETQRSLPKTHRHLAAPSTGTFNVLVLLVKFEDHADRIVPDVSYYDQMCNGEMKQYFAEQSYGKYNIKCHVEDWRVVPGTEQAHAGGVSGSYDHVQAAKFFEPILDDLSAEGNINWFDFDANGDGFIDNVVVVHSGFSAAGAGGQQCGENGPKNRIRGQGHTGGGLLSEAWADPDWGIQLQGFAISSAFERVCNLDNFAGMGTITHEWIHTFGAIDTYDVNNGGGGVGGLGSFDIMAHPGGYVGSTKEPGSISPFNKKLAGWLEYEEITEEKTYSIKPSNEAPNVYMIQKGFAEGEYLVIENRQPTSFDRNLFGGKGGLLIYHCDETIAGWGNAGFPGQTGWPDNGNHYKCALMQADGRFDLEQGVNSGDAEDLWTTGMFLGPGTNGAFPNTDSYYLGETKLRIYDILSVGSTMGFSVSWSDAVTAPPPNVEEPAVTEPTATEPAITEPVTTDQPDVEEANPTEPLSETKEPTKDNPDDDSAGFEFQSTLSATLIIILIQALFI